MRTFFAIFVFILGVGILGFGIFLMMNSGQERTLERPDPIVTPDPELTSQINVIPEPIPLAEQGDTIIVAAADGREISIQNPAKQIGVTQLGPNAYHYDGRSQLTPRPFSILYNSNNQSFAISLEQFPIEETREFASDFFLTFLGITSAEACQLNVFVSVPHSLAPDIAGDDLQLYYCARL